MGANMADEELSVEQDDPIKAAAAEADDAPEPEAEATEAEAAPDKAEVSAELGIEALKLQIEQEKAARIEAERRAREAQQMAARSESEVQDSNLQLIVSAIETVRRDSAMARRAYAEALAASDYERAAEIQEAMADNVAKLRQLENGRIALEERLKNPPPPPKPQNVDPVEALASQLSPRSAAWVRAHPEYATSQAKFNKMIGAHQMAVSDGIVPDSDEYFEAIENLLGHRKAAPPPAPAPVEETDEDAMSTAAKPVARKAPPPAAPPSRGSGSGSNTMRLTAAQREAAAISGLTEEEYAKNLMAANKRRTH